MSEITSRQEDLVTIHEAAEALSKQGFESKNYLAWLRSIVIGIIEEKLTGYNIKHLWGDRAEPITHLQLKDRIDLDDSIFGYYEDEFFGQISAHELLSWVNSRRPDSEVINLFASPKDILIPLEKGNESPHSETFQQPPSPQRRNTFLKFIRCFLYTRGYTAEKTNFNATWHTISPFFPNREEPHYYDILNEAAQDNPERNRPSDQYLETIDCIIDIIGERNNMSKLNNFLHGNTAIKNNDTLSRNTIDAIIKDISVLKKHHLK